MKKFYCLLAVLFATLSGCSGGDDASGGNKFTSLIEVNGLAFNPVAGLATTTFQPGFNGGMSNLRRFHLVDKDSKSLLLSVRYPASQASIDGIYDFNGNQANNGAAVSYNGTFEAMSTGTVTITDLGNDRYRLFFYNVVVSDTNLAATINGTCEGSFKQG